MARVLIATDGSELAHRAAARALALLGTAHDITIARIVSPAAALTPPVPGAAMAVGDNLADTATESAVREAGIQVTELARQLGVGATTRVEVGGPGAELCRLADEGGCDVLVVGSHGSGVLKRVLLGSVSHYVLHHAPCAVLVVRSRDQDDGEP